MREGRITQETIDELYQIAPAEVALQVEALRRAADELASTGGVENRRRAGALRARATVLSTRGDLAAPIELRVAKPSRTKHRHRPKAEYEKLVAAHGAILAVMGYVERVSGLTARWSGWLGFTHPADAGAMGFNGELRISRNYLEPLSVLGATLPAASLGIPKAKRQGREAGIVLVHEAFHAVSPYAQREYEKAPGAEEAIAEICMSLFYADAMRDRFGKFVAEAEPLDYPRYREPLERIANKLGVTRTDYAERAFYVGFLRRRTLSGRIGYLRRALLAAGNGPAHTGNMIDKCIRAWSDPDGGESARTPTQRPPRRVKRTPEVKA